MTAEMKWYIFDKNHHPLCWAEGDECPCCEFDTVEDATAFMDGCKNLPCADDLGTMEINECIFFYDGGKRNLSGYIPVANGDDVELERWRGE